MWWHVILILISLVINVSVGNTHIFCWRWAENKVTIVILLCSCQSGWLLWASGSVPQIQVYWHVQWRQAHAENTYIWPTESRIRSIDSYCALFSPFPADTSESCGQFHINEYGGIYTGSHPVSTGIRMCVWNTLIFCRRRDFDMENNCWVSSVQVLNDFIHLISINYNYDLYI